MGTDDLDKRLHYSMMTSALLKYIKDVENKGLYVNMSGIEKKDAVISLIQNNMPTIYQDHGIFIDVMIDALICVSNTPSILKGDKQIFMCCGC
jgi:hypothetical protein